MTPTVFISHAGGDTPCASEVADSMRGAGIAVRFDRAEATLGDSFLSFMEDSLHASDYCLLLWSRRAASTPWVQMEWESALYRSVAEKLRVPRGRALRTRRCRNFWRRGSTATCSPNCAQASTG